LCPTILLFMVSLYIALFGCDVDCALIILQLNSPIHTVSFGSAITFPHSVEIGGGGWIELYPQTHLLSPIQSLTLLSLLLSNKTRTHAHTNQGRILIPRGLSSVIMTLRTSRTRALWIPDVLCSVILELSFSQIRNS